MMMNVEQSVEWKLAGETEVIGENLPQCRFVHQNSTWPDLCWNQDRRGGKPATKRINYGTAAHLLQGLSFFKGKKLKLSL
jgi:hypothetical protein